MPALSTQPFRSPGKFEGQPGYARIAWEHSLGGCCEECGDVDDVGVHYAYVDYSDSPLAVMDHGEPHQYLAIIVETDSQGFVDVDPYEDMDAAQIAWGKIEASVERFYDDIEDDGGDYPDYGDCAICDGQLQVLGQLGRLTHLQCRNCGMSFEREI